jgi:SNF2 family DNA or RNA helicase
VGWWAGQELGVLVAGADGGQVLLQRDPMAELSAIERLLHLGLLGTDDGLFGIPGERPQDEWMRWADTGFTVLRDAGFELTLDAALNGWITHADTLDVALQPSDGGTEESTSPWFSLSLGMDIHGVRHNVLPWLPELIAAAAAQPPDPDTGLPRLPSHIYLPSQTGAGFVRLPTDALRPWMAALLDLVGDRVHDFTGDSLKLSRMDALRTSAALDEGVTWQGAQALRSLVVQLQGASALPTVPVPAGVQATLRPYQQQGLNWLQFLRAHGLAGVLADDMGLGKTLQTLVHIQVEKDAGRLSAPALVIAPVSLMGNWQREAARFCPGLRCLVLHGAGRHAVADAVAEHDLVIAPYSLLQRDRERWLAQPWHLVVLDEAQNIKNASTQAAQVVGALKARHRLCLSGTPMENHLGEIWSLFHFLMPGFLGSQQRFKELFRTPIEKQGDTARLAQLRARVTPFMLRRTKALVAGELPPKVESVMPVELAGAQADLYETIRLGMEKTVREALQSKGLAKSQITILDALLKLRQVCCHPALVPLDAARKVTVSAKLEQLMALLPGMLAEGRRILLFSQFTSMLTLIEAELKKRRLPWVKLTGQSQKRDAIIEQFTSGKVPLFLISLKAGGVGLNLPQADTVIHYDPWWNPAVENQATDRAHRIGQTQSVWVVKLVAQGTIEERILALQERKAQLAGSLYSGSAARKEPLFTESDLAELLQPLSSL